MPLEKKEQWTRYEAISLRGWKSKESRVFTFQDDGKDIPNTPQGLSYLYHVIEKGGKDIKELWIRPGGSLAIGLQEHVPLKNKTLKITKTTGADVKDTRYTAVPI